MKKVLLCITFLAFLLSIQIGFSQEIPTLQKYVNDFANVISAEDEMRINSLAAEIEKNWTVEIAVLTVPTIQPMSIEEYAVKTFEKNGIGKKDKDNGLLIVASIQDRKWRLEVGYGLEPVITDATAGMIGETYLTPYFREEEYGEGFYNAVNAVGMIFERGGDTSFISEEQISGEDVFTILILLITIFLFFIPLIMILISGFFRKCPDCGARMKCHYENDYLICECPKCGKKIKKKTRRHFWFFVGGLGRGGSGGGGGGGFGGGGSGGGGASGGW